MGTGLWILAPLLLLGTWLVFSRPYPPEVTDPPQPESPLRPPALEEAISRIRPPVLPFPPEVSDPPQPEPPSQSPALEEAISRIRPRVPPSTPADRLARAVCDPPIGWRIGVVHPGFGLQEREVHAAVEEAVALWERATGRHLFLYQPSGGMPIDLVYNGRQQRLAARIQEEERLTHWKSQLSRQPRSQREADHLRQEIALYNEAVEILRQNPLGSFWAGEYIHEQDLRTGRVSNRQIRIFTVASEADLISTLAHEMGHALGLEHVSDPLAIMTSKEEIGSRARPMIRPADLEEFYRRCGGGP